MESISLKFYLNKNKTKADKIKIYGRIIIKRNKAEFFTNFAVNPKNWDGKKECPKGDITLKQELLEIENRIYKIRRSFIDKGKNPTAREIVDVFKNKSNKLENIKLLDFYQTCIDEMIDKKELATSTTTHYTGTLKIIKMFCNDRKINNILVSDVDYKFVKDLDYYFTVEYSTPLGDKMARNTISKHHARLRAILNKAICEELMTFNPYSKFQLKYTKTNICFLTADELETFENAPINGN